MLTHGTVSVVIPCHNALRWIGATVESVLGQSTPPLEIIVVDDGSTDGTAESVRRNFPQVRVLEQPNAGVSAARNHGVAVARGDWVAFVDADDIWLPEKLQRQHDLVAAHPGAQMVYTAWHVWHSSELVVDVTTLQRLGAQRQRGQDWSGPSGWIYPELLVDCVVWTSTVMLQRRLFTELGGFDESLRVGEDYDLWFRASRVTSILRVPQPLALYRQHAANLTKRLPSMNHKGEVIGRALERWGYAAPDGRKAEPGAVTRGLVRSWIDFGGAHLSAGNRRMARLAVRRALHIRPLSLLAWRLLLKSFLPLGARRT
jgi:glycosyltransferase involved in cell wall biosynthesis